jgi:hypothetical protein
MNGRSLMAAGPHRDTRAYGVVLMGPPHSKAGDIVDVGEPLLVARRGTRRPDVLVEEWLQSLCELLVLAVARDRDMVLTFDHHEASAWNQADEMDSTVGRYYLIVAYTENQHGRFYQRDQCDDIELALRDQEGARVLRCSRHPCKLRKNTLLNLGRIRHYQRREHFEESRVVPASF